jgi:predicted nucleic acid-binding protein
VDTLFLDANVLFSAAYRKDAGVRRLWNLPGVKLVTSAYVSEEARRNLKKSEQRTDLEGLLRSMNVLGTTVEAEKHPVFEAVGLPEKDRPILLAAIDARATHLITGDFAHFGPYYGQEIEGVLILPPARYLRGFTGSKG